MTSAINLVHGKIFYLSYVAWGIDGHFQGDVGKLSVSALSF